MNAKAITLEVADDGTITIPVRLIHALRLSPRQTVTIETREDALVLVPSLRPGSLRLRSGQAVQAHRERLDRIGHLLRPALADVEWSEIEAGRRDRCF